MAEGSEIIFRPTTAGDIPVIQDLSSRIWREHYPGIITNEQIDYMLEKMYAPEIIRDEMEKKGYRYVIVSDSAMPVGYISYRVEHSAHAVLISKLYLLPSLHGRRIGARMLQYVKEDALRAGARLVYLYVNKNNVKAIRAYERFGFSKAQALVTSIGGGFVMDDYRMDLDLTAK